MPVGREVERAERLFLRFRRFKFLDWGPGVESPEDLYNRLVALSICTPAGREREPLFFIWLFHRSNFSERAARGKDFGGFLQPEAGLLICMPAG